MENKFVSLLYPTETSQMYHQDRNNLPNITEEVCDELGLNEIFGLKSCSLTEFFTAVRAKYPDQLFMADAATYEEGKLAFELGCDLIGTTMRSYTKATEGCIIPDFDLISKLANELGATVIAEGGIWEPWQLKKALEKEGVIL